MFGSKKMLGLLGLLTLAACSATGGAGSFCLTARPIYVDRADAFTPETARALLGHNETGARLCGWQASAAKDERR